MTESKKHIIYLVVIAALFGIVSEMDYREEVQREQLAKASKVQTYAQR